MSYAALDLLVLFVPQALEWAIVAAVIVLIFLTFFVVSGFTLMFSGRRHSFLNAPGVDWNFHPGDKLLPQQHSWFMVLFAIMIVAGAVPGKDSHLLMMVVADIVFLGLLFEYRAFIPITQEQDFNHVPPEHRYWTFTYVLCMSPLIVAFGFQLCSIFENFQILPRLVFFTFGTSGLVFGIHGIVRQLVLELDKPFELPHDAYLTVQCRELCMWACAMLLTSSLMVTGMITITLTIVASMMFYLSYFAMLWDAKDGSREIRPIGNHPNWVNMETSILPKGAVFGYFATQVSSCFQLYGKYTLEDGSQLLRFTKFINFTIGICVLYIFRLFQLQKHKKKKDNTKIEIQLIRACSAIQIVSYFLFPYLFRFGLPKEIQKVELAAAVVNFFISCYSYIGCHPMRFDDVKHKWPRASLGSFIFSILVSSVCVYSEIELMQVDATVLSFASMLSKFALMANVVNCVFDTIQW